VNVRNVPDHYNLVGHQLLTLGDGRLFLNTGTGAIAALDAVTGRILWVITWPARSDETYDEESNPQRHGLVPGLYHRGILYAVTEAHELFALDATTGQPTWHRQIRDRILHLLGIVDGRLILSGNSLWALDIHTGENAWASQPRLGFEDPDGFGYGRGVVTEQSVFWPLRDEILRIDHRTGEITRRIPLRQAYGLQGGNLLISGNYLVIAQSDRLDALADVTQPADDAATQPEEEVDQSDSAPSSDEPEQERVGSDSTTAVVVPPLWPVRRAWQQKIDPETVVSNPVNQIPGEFAAGIITQRNGQTRFIDGHNGRTLWTVNSSDRLIWSACHSRHMLLASTQQLESRNLLTGRLEWRINPDSGRFQRFRLQADNTPAGNHQLIALADTRVTAIDLLSGRRIWQWPPRGRRWTVPNSAAYGQRESWVADRSVLLIRPADSAEYSLLSLPLGHRLRHGLLPFDIDRPVSFVPVSGGTGRALIGIADVNSVRLTRLAELGPEWTQLATSQAHGAPRVLTSGNVIVVIEDAQFAVRRESATGNILWKRSLGPLPLNNVDNESVITPDALLAVSDGTLRCFSLQTGELHWHRHVGAGRWSIRPAGADFVICRPVPARVASVHPAAEASHHPRGSRIAVCDISNGKLIQRLSIDPHTHVVDVHAGAGYCCVRTTDTLHGFVPYVTTTVE
jgi:outer membrane protein assembly factor BamB